MNTDEQASNDDKLLPSIPFLSTQQADREIKNAIWRADNNMTNNKYLNRRDVKFFEGSLSHLNTREIAYEAQRKRDQKVNKKKILNSSSL